MNCEEWQYYDFIQSANLDVTRVPQDLRELANRECRFAVESTWGLVGSPMTAWIGGYRGSSIIRMKNDSEVST